MHGEGYRMYGDRVPKFLPLLGPAPDPRWSEE